MKMMTVCVNKLFYYNYFFLLMLYIFDLLI